MKGTKMQKGITLIALIITIIVLLILAVVAIREIQGEGIISHTKNAIKEHQIGREKETITLSIDGWKIEKKVNKETTFKSFMEESLKDEVSVKGPDAGPLTVTFEDTKNQYIVTDDGTITFIEKSIIVKDENGNIISESTITVEVGKTKVLTVEKTGGLEGEITYKSSDDTIATIDESGKITGIAEGTTKIKIECGKHKIECEVTVTNIPVDPPIDEIPEDLETYILGEADADGNRPGKPFGYNSSTGEGIFNGEGFVNQSDTLVANGGVQFVDANNDTFEVTITYMNEEYIFNVNSENGLTYNLRKLIVKELNAEGKIEAIEDLVDFAITVNNGNNLAGKTITLEKSLDFTKDEDYKNPMDTTYGDINGNGNDQEGIKAELTSGTGFMPIGTLITENDTFITVPFSGNFEGNGNTISNLYINNQEIFCSGLFGAVGTEGNTIKDLTLINPVVNNAYYFTGGIIGHADGSSSLNIDNCHVIGNGTTSTIGTGAVTGGIIGEVGAYQGNDNQTITITDCTVESQTIIGASKVAGIIGGADVGNLIVSDCRVIDTNITAIGNQGETIAAGIAIGHDNIRNDTYDTDMTITSCSTEGTTTVTSPEYVSGIAAFRNGRVMKIEKCTNGAALDSDNAEKITWFLCGELLRPGGSMEVTEDCVNNGTLVDTTLDSSSINDIYVYNDYSNRDE